MDKLRAIKYFIRVSELGSFTNAASEFRIAKSLISKEISKLESDVGAKLLHRSTRRLGLTKIGEEYLNKCLEVVNRLDEADAQVLKTLNLPKGKLKINVSMAMGNTVLGEALAEFMVSHPEIELEVQLSDDSVDLIEHGFDLGFRAVSKSFDTNYIGRVLTEFDYKICTSEAYIRKRGPVIDPKQLAEHDCFVYSYFRRKNIWPLGEGIAIRGPLIANNTMFMMHMIKRGLGIGFIPDFVCKESLKKGEVIEILKDVSRPKLTLYALYPAREFVPPRVTECIKFIENWFRDNKLINRHPT